VIILSLGSNNILHITVKGTSWLKEAKEVQKVAEEVVAEKEVKEILIARTVVVEEAEEVQDQNHLPTEKVEDIVKTAVRILTSNIA